MKKRTLSWFASTCGEALADLVETYGFSGPEEEQIGHETFVRFHLGDRTVCISCEPGSAPLVELFYPAGTLEETVPWAERNGVQRTRRIPALETREKFSSASAETYGIYIKALSQALLSRETEFIHGGRTVA